VIVAERIDGRRSDSARPARGADTSRSYWTFNADSFECAERNIKLDQPLRCPAGTESSVIAISWLLHQPRSDIAA
jgi:hypothetical protein